MAKPEDVVAQVRWELQRAALLKEHGDFRADLIGECLRGGRPLEGDDLVDALALAFDAEDVTPLGPLFDPDAARPAG